MDVNPVPNDYSIQDPIDDSISQMKFYPNSKNLFLGSGGWDATIRVWSVNYEANNIQTTAKIMSNLVFKNQLTDPILSIAWRPDPIGLFAGKVIHNF